MNVTISQDLNKIRADMVDLRLNMAAAVSRALNRTGTTVRTQAVRLIAQDVGLAQTVVRRTIEETKARVDRPEYRLIATGRRLPLILFKARQVRAGVTYALGRGRNLVRGAFIATMRSGHRGVFVRRGPRRLPIVELRGPSLPHVFAQARIESVLREIASTAFAKNLAHELEFQRRRLAA